MGGGNWKCATLEIKSGGSIYIDSILTDDTQASLGNFAILVYHIYLKKKKKVYSSLISSNCNEKKFLIGWYMESERLIHPHCNDNVAVDILKYSDA